MKRRTIPIWFPAVLCASLLGHGGHLCAGEAKKGRARLPQAAKTDSTAVAPSTPSVRSSLLLLNKGLLRPRNEVIKYNEPMDLIELIPVIRDINRMIPRQFSLADHEFRLDPQKMVIQHEFLDLKARSSAKNSIISLTYTGVAGQLGTRLDIPLFYSSVLGFSNWSRYPMGNYTMTINRDNPFSDEKLFYIKALTRF
jgi:hypothetical protein